MSGPAVVYEKRGGIAIITINRPEKMNAYNAEVNRLEKEVFSDFRDDPDMLVAIITGAGEKAFCAGADMNAIRPSTSTGPSASTGVQSSEEMYHLRDAKVYKPIIAAINGYCLSGGLSLALDCDVRIAAEHASFGLQQARYGARSPNGVQELTRHIGLSRALYLIVTGTRIGAQEALQMGIVHKVVPLKDLMSTALEVAEAIQMNSPTHVRVRKEAAIRFLNLPFDEACRMGGILEDQVPPEEKREGIAAFLEKRKPNWHKMSGK